MRWGSLHHLFFFGPSSTFFRFLNDKVEQERRLWDRRVRDREGRGGGTARDETEGAEMEGERLHGRTGVDMRLHKPRQKGPSRGGETAWDETGGQD
jgi:hypothetical protein